MQRAIYLISGLPGAGKSSVSYLLAKRLERGVHIEADLVQQMIVAGSVWPEWEPREEAMRQFELRRRNVSMLADSFFDAEFTPVIDDIVIGSHIDEYVSGLRGRPLLFVMLVPRPDVVRAREMAREKYVFDKWAHLDDAIRRETPRAGWLLDSSDMTTEETVDAILREGGERGRIE
ncbi:MAG: phosphotransferase [Dehalococcoidia bacterium]